MLILLFPIFGRLLVGMYLRSTARANKDGSKVRYLALAHNEKVDGVSQAKVLLNLGREDQLDREGLRRLVSSLTRYLGDPDPYADPDADPVAGLDGDLQPVAGRGAPAGRVVAPVGYRPGVCGSCWGNGTSPRMWSGCCSRWSPTGPWTRPPNVPGRTGRCHDVAIDGLGSMSDDQAYRAMDLLVEADATAGVQEAVFFAVANLLNLDVDVILFDTTSTYFLCRELHQMGAGVRLSRGLAA